jgi:hypothetical protein
VVLTLQALAVYQLVFRDHGPPSFRRGGAFVAAGTNGRPLPYAPAGASDDPNATTTTAAADAPPASGAPSPFPAVGVGAPSTDGADNGGSPVEVGPPPVPAVGTYMYEVAGSESASGFGSRDYPSTMTFDAHTSPDATGQVVVDLRFSQDHEEREILERTPDGLAFAFEGGSITFGPGTQTSEADYDPPMVQIPAALTPGSTISGASAAKNNDGSTSRVEDWAVSVVGQETLDVGGTSVDTWVVDVQRTSRPGSSDQVNRYRRYWYDPSRALWVRWHEIFHGSRDVSAFSFHYDTDYTATLTTLPTASSS